MIHPSAELLFDHEQIRMDLLRQRAFNLRWASVEPGVIPLTAADPDFPCAPGIADAIARYARDRYLSYAPAEGLSFFREAMAMNYNERKQVNAKPEFVIACDSAAFGIYTVCKAFLKPGDEAVVFNPVDFLFKHSVEAAGAQATLLDVPLDPNDPIDLHRLQQLITPRTKLICLCNPLNPTGKVFTREELEQLAIIAEQNNLLILSDEIWSDIVFEPSTYISMAAIPAAEQRTIVVTGFSKSYGLAGLRAGAILAFNQTHFECLMEASGHRSTVHGCNVLAQVAAAAALTEAGEWLNAFVDHLHRMRDFTVNSLNELPGVRCHLPLGCYVAFANITDTGASSEELHQLWLAEAKVAVVPGLPRWFGSRAENHVRLSFATSATILEEAFDRIKKIQTR
jgi:aspartate/methionine/tyrosine aminotransferase